MNNIVTTLRNGASNLVGRASQGADAAYHWLLPKPAKEYAKRGLAGFVKLGTHLTIDAIVGAAVVFKSLGAGLIEGLKGTGYLIKGGCWDLPKVAYHRYRQSQLREEQQVERVIEEEAVQEGIQETAGDFSQAVNQFGQALSVGASIAYQGLAPLLYDAAGSIVFDGGGLALDAAALATIAAVEGGKLATHHILLPAGTYLANGATHLASRMANAVSALGAQARPEMALVLANNAANTVANAMVRHAPPLRLSKALQLPSLGALALAAPGGESEMIRQAMKAQEAVA